MLHRFLRASRTRTTSCPGHPSCTAARRSTATFGLPSALTPIKSLIVKTKLSNKGLVTLPTQLRQKLGIRSGDILTVCVEGNNVVLLPKSPRKFRKSTLAS